MNVQTGKPTRGLKPLPEVFTFSEIKRIVHMCGQYYPQSRKGQALCHVYAIPKELEEAIWELNDTDTVAQQWYKSVFGKEW